MTDLLANGSAWLEGQRHTHLTTTVTYERGTSEVVLQATIGRTEFEQADEFGLVRKVQTRDYLIRAADLVIAGSLTLPQIGDRIRETEVSGVTYWYDVVGPGDEPPWRYSDPYRQALRIHTKHTATGTV